MLDELQKQRFAASSLQQEFEALPGVLDLVRTVGYALVAVLLLLTAFASYQVTSALARQRTREVGVLKAVGFSDGRVFGVIASESMVVAGMAALVGLVLSIVVATAATALLRQRPAVRPYLSSGVVIPHADIAAIAVLAVFAVLASGALLPARRASRLAPADAIREW